MKKLVVIFWILGSFISVGFAEMSKAEWEQNLYGCYINENSIACEALIDNGLTSVSQCDKTYKSFANCAFLGGIYKNAGRTQEAIKYFNKAIDLGDYTALHFLGILYDEQNKFIESFKYFTMACEKINANQDETIKKVKAAACFNLATLYDFGKGRKQDYIKASEFYKIACDLGDFDGCHNLGFLYDKGQGVKQSKTIAKQYYEKACDLGDQISCVKYRNLNKSGVQ